MERVVSPVAGLALLIVGLGCGEGGQSGGGGGSGGSAGPADLCRASCGREVRCGYHATESECLSNCLAKNGRMMALLDPSFSAAAAKCYPDLSCEASDDPCVGAAVMSVAPNGNKDSPYVSCRSRLSECRAEDTLTVVCVYATVFTQQGRSSLEACLAKPCAEVGGNVAELTGL